MAFVDEHERNELCDTPRTWNRIHGIGSFTCIDNRTCILRTLCVECCLLRHKSVKSKQVADIVANGQSVI